jgi:hypothetical protein
MENSLSPVRPVLKAVVGTVVPEASALDAKAWRELEELVEAALRDRSPGLKRRLRLLLRVVQWLPLFRYGRPFTWLAPAERELFLSYLQDHRMERVRVGFWGLRTLVLLGYYGRREAAKAIGYAADPRGWEAVG